MDEEEKIWTPANILLMIEAVLIGFTVGLFGGALSAQGRSPQSPYVPEGMPPEQLYIPPPSTASPETIVIRSEPGATIVAEPTFYLTVDVVDEQGNPLVAIVTVNRGCTGNEQCPTRDPATRNFLAISMQCNGSEEDHEMLEVIARAEGYYTARQRFDVTTVGHSSYHLVLKLEESVPTEVPRS